MFRFRVVLIVAFGIYMVPSMAWSQSGFSNAKVSIVDGAVTLEGVYQDISAIEVVSGGEHLSLQTQEFENAGTINLTSPFTEDGLVVSNRPGKVVLGVLGADNRIDFSGTTKTSILYAESQSIAQAGDLTLNIAAGGCTQPLSIGMSTPATASCIDRQWAGGTSVEDPKPVFKLVDGEIYIEGKFENLASIEITSANGNLSLGNIASGIPDFTPFDGQATVIESGNTIVLGAIGPGNRIDISGQTKTSIQYAESLDFARADLTVNIGLGDGSPQAITVGSVEEITNLGVTVDDGFLTMVGTFSQLAGIEAISAGGYAFVEEVPTVGTKLFPASDASIVSNDENKIVINTGNGVDLSGFIATGISFSGNAEAFALADLQVLVGLGTAAPISLPDTTESVPEPSSAILSLLAVLGVLCVRRKRCRA